MTTIKGVELAWPPMDAERDVIARVLTAASTKWGTSMLTQDLEGNISMALGTVDDGTGVFTAFPFLMDIERVGNLVRQLDDFLIHRAIEVETALVRLTTQGVVGGDLTTGDGQ